MTTYEQQEILELLLENGIHAYIEPSNRGPVLKVIFKYPLQNISDYKGLVQRLVNFKELGSMDL